MIFGLRHASIADIWDRHSIGGRFPCSPGPESPRLAADLHKRPRGPACGPVPVGYKGEVYAEGAAPAPAELADLGRLGDEHPAAAQLLCVGAVLHPAPLPLDVFGPALGSLPPPLGRVAPAAVAGLVAVLTDAGLARVTGRALVLPAQVRSLVRDDLGAPAVAVCRAYAGGLLAAAAPADVADPATWPRWAALAPHLVAAGAEHSSDPALRDAAARLVASLLHRGRPRPARTIAAALHAGWRELLGPDHPDPLRAGHDLARALIAVGALLPARALLDDTVARLAGTLGAGHPQTAAAAETRRGVLARMGGAPGRAPRRKRKRSG